MIACRRAFLIVPLAVCAILTALGFLGYFACNALGLPQRLHLPVGLRAAGIVPLALGFFILGWLMKYRKPANIVISTYLTMRSVFRNPAPNEKTPRTELLIVQGPQRCVRHPLYLADVILVFGWWLVLDYTFILLMVFFLWFNLVVIHFEERELRELFGEQYEAYAKAAPRFFPALKCLRRGDGKGKGAV